MLRDLKRSVRVTILAPDSQAVWSVFLRQLMDLVSILGGIWSIFVWLLRTLFCRVAEERRSVQPGGRPPRFLFRVSGKPRKVRHSSHEKNVHRKTTHSAKQQTISRVLFYSVTPSFYLLGGQRRKQFLFKILLQYFCIHKAGRICAQVAGIVGIYKTGCNVRFAFVHYQRTNHVPSSISNCKEWDFFPISFWAFEVGYHFSRAFLCVHFVVHFG